MVTRTETMRRPRRPFIEQVRSDVISLRLRLAQAEELLFALDPNDQLMRDDTSRVKKLVVVPQPDPVSFEPECDDDDIPPPMPEPAVTAGLGYRKKEKKRYVRVAQKKRSGRPREQRPDGISTKSKTDYRRPQLERHAQYPDRVRFPWAEDDPMAAADYGSPGRTIYGGVSSTLTRGASTC